MSDPKGVSGGVASPWAIRLQHAHANAVENVLIFAAAVLALVLTDRSTPLTQIAAMVYFLARCGHILTYVAGIGPARTMMHTVAWIAQIFIILTVLGWM